MGLDQYAFAATSVEDLKDRNTSTEISYWRKHNRLQGWMENLYRTKSDDTGDFNCVPLELTEDDLMALQDAINSKELPETGGFFFGHDSYEDYHSEYGYFKADQDFIKEAQAHLQNGKKVFYYCWW